ncbi:hypothetical protein K9M74_03875 [Candidatus Woesearchaeota archaeon]|nr:hypothetical protein [Candidatus Woesearchaeota archaeon]
MSDENKKLGKFLKGFQAQQRVTDRLDADLPHSERFLPLQQLAFDQQQKGLQDLIKGRIQTNEFPYGVQNVCTNGVLAAEFFLMNELADLTPYHLHIYHSDVSDGITPLSNAEIIYAGVQSGFIQQAVENIFNQANELNSQSYVLNLMNNYGDIVESIAAKSNMQLYVVLPAYPLQSKLLFGALRELNPQSIYFIQE